jgi:hypothetical protein
MDQKDLENRFNYHKPDEDKAKLHSNVRASCLWLAQVIDQGEEFSND